MTEFWQWFQENNKAFLFINQIEDLKERDRLLEGLLSRLHDYCDGLYFEIGGHPDEKIQELIITAEGELNYFDEVEALISAAPEMENWRFIAFKPPMGVEFAINYEDVELDPKQMWFLPMENPDYPDMLGVKIGVLDYDRLSNNEWLDAAIFKVIDTVIGEKSFSIDIDYIETTQLPTDDPEEKGYLPVDELADFIKWKKQR